MRDTIPPDGDDLDRLLRSSLGTLPDRAMRLFAVDCCRRVSQNLADHWHHGVDVAVRFAEGSATRDELLYTLGYLTRDFEEVIESDNGEIYAAKQSVLACLDPRSPFDPTEAAAKARKSAGRAYDNDQARLDEEMWQLDEFQGYLAGIP
jgi:hypothetical protein